jgi:ribosomal protein L35
MKAHNLEKKSQKRKRGFRKLYEVSGEDVRDVKRLLGAFRRTK